MLFENPAITFKRDIIVLRVITAVLLTTSKNFNNDIVTVKRT